MTKEEFDIDQLNEMYYNEPCNKKVKPVADYKLCKDCIHKYFFKCTKGEHFIWNAELN